MATPRTWWLCRTWRFRSVLTYLLHRPSRKLFENIDGKYIDVSSNAGIFQGKIGYGLGVSVGDLNNDGYPDIYVGNDFFENDYLYLNNRDKTFKEVISENKTKLGHTSHYSMGNALADLDNNEALDIISLFIKRLVRLPYNY